MTDGIYGINLLEYYCDPEADRCSDIPASFPKISSSSSSVTASNGLSTTTTVEIDPQGRRTAYTYSGYFGPVVPLQRLTKIEHLDGPADITEITYQDDQQNATVVASILRHGVKYAYSATEQYTGQQTGFPRVSGRTIVRTDPLGHTVTYKAANIYQNSGRITEIDVGSVQKDFYNYDINGLLTYHKNPEGITTTYTYDGRGNVLSRTVTPKPGSGLVPAITTAKFSLTCDNPLTCNKPEWVEDENHNRTNFAYDENTGQVSKIERPAPVAGAARPTKIYTYLTLGGISLPKTISVCATASTCAGTPNEDRTSFTYNANALPITVTEAASDNSVVSTVHSSYDGVGNLVSIDGPLSGAADTTTYRYDRDRNAVGVIYADPDGSSPLKRRAVRITYNGLQDITRVEIGTTLDSDESAWNSFALKQQVDITYDSFARKTRETKSAANVTFEVTDYSYDSLGRLDCATKRMNEAKWGVVTSACTPQTVGNAGPDRISRNVLYDEAGRPMQTVTSYGQADSSTIKHAYTLDGKLASVTDGENNKTTYVYDGFDRLSRTEFPGPLKGAGTSSAVDYEQLTYDLSGNIVTRRLRDGQSINYTYDHLNRMTIKNLPGSEPDISYGYDLADRQTSVTRSGSSLTFAYDALGRLLRETGPQGTLTSTWDAGGRRTELRWPDGFYVTYDYDVIGQMTAVRENGATSGAGVLARYSYDDVGNRTGATYGNGTTSTWTPDSASRLAALKQNLAGTSYDLTRSDTYNPAGQIARMTSSNDSYAWSAAANVNRSYTANGLNQYTISGSTALGYDARGNLTSSGADAYTYTSENLMQTGPGSTSLTYDPLLRLYQVTKGPTTTRFSYDGLEVVAEYNASNVLTKRYVYGPGPDEPIVQYTGISTSSRTWLHADERGSVIALSDSSGNMVAIDSYDEYGIPGTANSGRFQYTGQMWLPEIGMYYYKARMYSPSLGRFMQTDPVGYADGLNWYNYVGGDPLNTTDPNGEEGNGTVLVIGSRIGGMGGLSAAPGLGMAGQGFSGVSLQADLQTSAEKKNKSGENDRSSNIDDDPDQKLLHRLEELRKKIQACPGAASSPACAPLWKEYAALLNSPRGRLLRARDVDRHTTYLRHGLELLGAAFIPVAKGAKGGASALLTALGAAAVAGAIDEGIDWALSGGEDPVGEKNE